jgi:hypothetical protein
MIAIVAAVVARNANGGLLTYEPYPTVSVPAASVWLLLGLFGLFVPAIVGPGWNRDD